MASVYKATYTKPGPQGTRIKKRSRLYTIEYTDAHGVRRKISSKTADKKAALFLSNELEKQAARGRVGALDPFEAGKKTPLAAHLEAYEAYHRQQETADRHRKQVLARLRSAFSAIRATFPSDVTVPRVEKYLGKLQAEGRGARTRNSHLSSLKAFFTWCVRTQRLEANPLSSIPWGAKTSARFFEALDRTLRHPFEDLEVG